MGLGDFFSKAWEVTKDFVGKTTSSVKSAAIGIVDKLKDGANAAKNVVTSVYGDVKSGLGGIKETIDNAIKVPGQLLGNPLLWIGGIAAGVVILPLLLKR